MLNDYTESEKSEELKKRSFHIAKEQRPERIDAFLTRQIENATRTKVQAAIDEERVLVNGNPVKTSYKIRGGDVIDVTFTRPPAPEMKPEPIPLDIIFEDDALLIINKPPGMVVHPAFGNWVGTLANAALYHTKKLATVGGHAFRPGIIHRLDKDTSGIIAIAKSDEAALLVSRQFAQRKIKKAYLAITLGEFKSKHGRIETNIGRSKKNRKIMSCYPTYSKDGKYALTEFEVVSSNSKNGFSLVRLTLHTGRTHQLRVHLQYIGKPILGDRTYSGTPSDCSIPFPNSKLFLKNLLQIMPRQALHAFQLGFVHPQTNKEVFFQAELPQDMKDAVKKIGLKN